MNTTFIIPIRIDSEQRLENINIVSNYLLKHTDSLIMITERDTCRKVFLPENKRIIYIFQKMENNIFHRTKILNEMLNKVTTTITCNYDADVILNKSSYKIAEDMIINQKYDLVYPFGFSEIDQIQIKNNHPNYNKFKQTLDENLLIDTNSNKCITQWGHVQFFKTESYKNGFMENENFKEHAPEDAERGIRFQKLGYKVGFFRNKVFHIEHPKNPLLIPSLKREGEKLFDMIKSYNKEQLISYYNKQNYLNKYKRD